MLSAILQGDFAGASSSTKSSCFSFLPCSRLLYAAGCVVRSFRSSDVPHCALMGLKTYDLLFPEVNLGGIDCAIDTPRLAPLPLCASTTSALRGCIPSFVAFN